MDTAAASHCRCNRCAGGCGGKLQLKRSVCAKCRDKRCVCKVCGQSRRKLASAHDEYVAPCKCTKSAPPGRAKRTPFRVSVAAVDLEPTSTVEVRSPEPNVIAPVVIDSSPSRVSARVCRVIQRPGQRHTRGLDDSMLLAPPLEHEEDAPVDRKRSRLDDGKGSPSSSVVLSSQPSTPIVSALHLTASVPRLLINPEVSCDRECTSSGDLSADALSLDALSADALSADALSAVALSAVALPAPDDGFEVTPFDPLRHIVDDSDGGLHRSASGHAAHSMTLEFVNDCLVQVPDSDPWFQTSSDFGWDIPMASDSVF